MPRDGVGGFNLIADNPVVEGTDIETTWANATMADVASALAGSIAADGQTTLSGNLKMGAFKVTNLAVGSARTDSAHLGQVQDGTFLWGGTAGGTANALTLSLVPAITALVTPQIILFKASATNTAAVTVAVNGLTPVAIQNNAVALVGGEIITNKFYQLLYDGTQFQLLHFRALPDVVTWGRTGQCNLKFTSSTILTLFPRDGNKILVSGVEWTITNTGITISNASATASTLYYIYAHIVANTLTLEKSTTVPVRDSGTGYMIKTGDASRSLVGMAKTNASSNWEDSLTIRHVRSWFGPQDELGLRVYLADNFGAASATFEELGTTGFSFSALLWAGELLNVHASGGISRNTPTGSSRTRLDFYASSGNDLDVSRSVLNSEDGETAFVGGNFTASVDSTCVAKVFVAAAGGGTGTYYGTSGTATISWSMHGLIH